MKQGYSGSTVQRKGSLVEKISSDASFAESEERQRDLIALSRSIAVLPRIDHIASPSIYMEYVDGEEGLTEGNAPRAGRALRLLHQQRSYPHPCMTGLSWLIDMANENLAQASCRERIPADFLCGYPSDALIHSEPSQFIEKDERSIVFIDFEGIGMGSRYQDLGFVYYRAILEDQPIVYTAFARGYQPDSAPIELRRVKQLAGIISLAYARFADAEERMRLGLRLCAEAGAAG